MYLRRSSAVLLRNAVQNSVDIARSLGATLVQLERRKWLPICKRHQIGLLDFRSFRLLTQGRGFRSAESAIGFGRRLQRRDIPSCLEHLEQPKQVAKL
jgi:hypothetical protein